MKKNSMSFLMLTLLALLLWSCGKSKDDTKDVATEANEEKFDDSDRQKDTDFAVEVADAGMLEVQLGNLAQTNASSAEVKKFAQMMIDDHSKANDELKALAAQKNITLPTAMSDKLQKKYNDLSEKKGTDFDKDYMDLMVSDHKDVVDKFEKQAEDGKDADLKAWASGKLTTLRQHLEHAQTTSDAVKNAKDAKK